MNWADHIIKYYFTLSPPQPLPKGMDWLHPQQEKEAKEVVKKFYQKFYNDGNERVIMLGINPGRFGAGVTGVNFTAPRQLKTDCGIDHPFKDQSELSAEFIYQMIRAFGGAQKFYSKIFIGSVCPLGLVKEGKNINYYDDKALIKFIEPFIIKTLDDLVKGSRFNKVGVSIGGEKNYKYLSGLNEKFLWFEKIIALPHPRFIMQYKRRFMNDYVLQYVNTLTNLISGPSLHPGQANTAI